MRALSLTIVLLMIAATVQAGPGQYATPVLHTEDAAVWMDAAPTYALGYYDVANDNIFQSADTMVLAINPAGTITVNDVIMSGTSAGQVITSGHAANTETLKTVHNGNALNGLVKYSDAAPTGGDSQFGNGDGVYVDLDNDNVVSAGDLRLVVHSGRAFGSLAIAGESDVTAGLALTTFNFAAGANVYMHDLTGDGYSSDDSVYVDVDGNRVPNTGDLRWRPYRNAAAGQFVKWNDQDSVALISTFAGDVLSTGVTGPVLISNSATVGAQDAGDLSVATHSDCAFRKVLAAATECVPSAGAYGSSALVTRYLESGHSSGFDSQDTLYVHVGGGTTVALGDVRLTAYLAKAAGTRVVNTDGDNGQATLALAGGWKYLDIDGNGIVSPGDVYYVDIDNDGFASVGDLRFSAATGLAAGQYVSAGQADYEPVLEDLPGPATAALAYHDDINTGTFHIEDPVLVQLVSGAGATFDTNDLLISAAADGTAGTFLTSSSSVKGETAVTTTALTFRYFDADSSASYTVGDYVYATQGVGSEVNIKDVRLTTVGGNGLGTRVTASHTDAGLTTLPFTNSEIQFEDRDGDDKVSAGDRIYLNVDAGGEDGAALGFHLVSALDFRLSGTGGTTKVGNPSAPATGGGSPPPTQTQSQTQTVTQTSSTSTTVTPTATDTSTQVVTVTDTGSSTTTDTATEEPVPGLGLVAILLAIAGMVAYRRRL